MLLLSLTLNFVELLRRCIVVEDLEGQGSLINTLTTLLTSLATPHAIFGVLDAGILALTLHRKGRTSTKGQITSCASQILCFTRSARVFSAITKDRRSEIVICWTYKRDLIDSHWFSHSKNCLAGNDSESLDPALSCVLNVRALLASTVPHIRTPRNMIRVR